MTRILLVEDDDDLRGELARGLERAGHEVTQRRDGSDVIDLLATEIDVVITDVNLGQTSGIALAERIVSNRRDIPVIVITAFGTLETAIATLRAGATDFLPKPFGIDQLLFTVDRALHQKTLETEVKLLREEVSKRTTWESIIGDSKPMRELFGVLDRISATDATLLLSGESGTGKEVIARGVHARSERSRGPFVAINCAAVPEQLLESELFGHARGAFTDAKQARRGLFLEASGGTLVLDEIGDMPLGMQAKLLRALETRNVRPVGGDAEIAFDVRVIAATHRDLEALVESGSFRQDLFYRLNVIQVHIPPLRQRGQDILLLAQTFLERFALRHRRSVKRLSVDVASRLLAHSWPGNVRELQNTIERAVALARYDELTVDDLPPKLRETRAVRTLSNEELVSLDELEGRHIARVMEAVDGNKAEATRILGIDRSTLYRKLQRHKIA